jgi:hypothetical protein
VGEVNPIGRNSVPLTYSAIWDRIRSVGVDDLTEAEIAFVAAFEFCSEASNGGLWQFFVNSKNRYTQDTISALRRTGFFQSAELLETALKSVEFPEGFADNDMKWDFADKFYHANKKFFDRFDKDWSKTNESTKFVEFLEGFLDKNRSEFKSLRYKIERESSPSDE